MTMQRKGWTKNGAIRQGKEIDARAHLVKHLYLVPVSLDPCPIVPSIDETAQTNPFNAEGEGRGKLDDHTYIPPIFSLLFLYLCLLSCFCSLRSVVFCLCVYCVCPHLHASSAKEQLGQL